MTCAARRNRRLGLFRMGAGGPVHPGGDCEQVSRRAWEPPAGWVWGSTASARIIVMTLAVADNETRVDRLIAKTHATLSRFEDVHPDLLTVRIFISGYTRPWWTPSTRISAAPRRCR